MANFPLPVFFGSSYKSLLGGWTLDVLGDGALCI